MLNFVIVMFDITFVCFPMLDFVKCEIHFKILFCFLKLTESSFLLKLIGYGCNCLCYFCSINLRCTCIMYMKEITSVVYFLC